MTSLTNSKNGKKILKRKKKVMVLAAALAIAMFCADWIHLAYAKVPEFEITGFQTELDAYEFDIFEEINFTWSLSLGSNYSNCWIIWGDGTDNYQCDNQTFTTTHAYQAEGKYTVTLWVVDKWGNKDSQPLGVDGQHPNGKQIIVKNNAPTFNINFSDDNPNEDDLVTISVDDLEDSDYDLKHKVHSYIFDFGDGSEQIQTTENFTTHKYENAGNYPVSITCFDDQLALSQETQVIEVINEPPTASFKLGAEIPSTFPFSNDIIGRIPFGWKEHTPATRNAIKIVDNKDSFVNVLEITGNPGYELPAIKTYVGEQYFGTIEYHFRSTNVSEKVGYMALYSGSSEKLAIYPENGVWKYRINGGSGGSGSVGGECENPQNDVWTHVRVDFLTSGSYLDLPSNKFRVIIDGKISAYHDFSSSINYIIAGSFENTQTKAYIDSIGLSWDENYNVGENFNYFENSYYGTHDFRNEVIGNPPEKWNVYIEDASDTGDYYGTYTFPDDEGSEVTDWTLDQSAGIVEVIESLAGHNKVLKLQDSMYFDQVSAQNSFSNQESGDIEFYMYASDSEKRNYVMVRDGTTRGPRIDVSRGYLRYTSWETKNIRPLSSNKWYHIRMSFECGSGGYQELAPDTFYVYVNGIRYGPYPFNNGIAHVDNLLFLSGKKYDDSFGTSYYDAIGYSWDSNYVVGDNLRAGLDISVVDEGEYYKEAVRLTDRSIGCAYMENAFENQNYGTIEWFVKSSNAIDNAWAMTFMDADQKELLIFMDNNEWKYSYGGSSNYAIIGCGVPLEGQFHHVRLDFCADDSNYLGLNSQFNVTIDGVVSTTTYDFNSANHINKIRFESGPAAKGITVLDALSFSWDDTYNIGLNKIPLMVYPEKSLVQFSAASSADTESDLDSLKYVWQFDDGTVGSGKYIEHTYLESGVYRVNLTVQDDNGAKDSCTEVVLIKNVYPSINLNAGIENITILEGDTVQFTTDSSDDLSDWARVLYGWGRDDSEFDPYNFSTYEHGGWRGSQIFKDDWGGNIYATIKDPEGAFDFDFISVDVENVDPLISIWDANVISNVTFEIYRNSINKEANFTINVMANNESTFDTFLTYENLDESSIKSNTTVLPMSLSKIWKITINSTELPENSWFKYYARLKFLDGQELVISSEKLYGTGENYGYWEKELSPYWYDNGDFSFMYPLTFNATIFDPSLDDINATIAFTTNTLLIINCSDTLPIEDSYTEEFSFGNVSYVVNVFEQEGVKYANITARYQVVAESYDNNDFPVWLELNFTIYPIVDLFDVLEVRLNLTELDILQCVEANNYIYAKVLDDDLGQSDLSIKFYTHYNIEFQNLSPAIKPYIPGTSTTVHTITFYAQISDFDQTPDSKKHYISNFKSEYIPTVSEDFDLIKGTIEGYGELQFQNNEYTILSSSSDGIYKGTDSFTNETVGNAPSNWDLYDIPSMGTITVISELDGHSMVMDVYDTSSSGKPQYSWILAEGYVTEGTVEFWHRTTDRTKLMRLMFYSPENYKGVWISVDDNYYRYNDGAEHNIYALSNKVWYRHRIDFSCASRSYNWTIYNSAGNSLYAGINLAFYSDSCDSINRIFGKGSSSDSNYHNYFDAFGMSWDSGYNVGENAYIPHSLEFTSKFQVESMDDNEVLKYLKLFYAVKASNSLQMVNISLYNFNSHSWDLIESMGVNANWYVNKYSILSSEYLNSTYVILMKMEAVNATEEFQLYLDQLRLEYYSAKVSDSDTFKNEVVPLQPNDFNVISGSANFGGDLNSQDNDYSTFTTDNSGLYLGTDSFTNETVGNAPSNWDLYDVPSMGTITVISELDSHSMVMDVYDTSSSGKPQYSWILAEGYVTEGTVEFWHRTTDRTKLMRLMFYSPENYKGVWISVDDNYYRYNDGAEHNIYALSNKVWYRHRIDFSCASRSYNWTIYNSAGNSLYAGINLAFYSDSCDSINRIFGKGSSSDSNYHNYFDAFGMSWDSSYNVGNNAYPADNLITFTSNFRLNGIIPGDWINFLNLRYSLKTTQSQTIKLYLYNYTSQNFVEINSFSRLEFTLENYSIPIATYDFYSNYFEVKVKFEAENSSSFECYLDTLKLEYSWRQGSSEDRAYEVVPKQTESFSLEYGRSDWSGCLNAENDYTIFSSENATLTYTVDFKLEYVDVGDNIDALELNYSYKTN
ncbi:MAG: PKD domain-containing protein, partial [Promethearchaeota archaeon]